MRVARRIKKFRKRYKVTQVQFAELIGVAPTTVKNWENERTMPFRKRDKKRIEAALNGGSPFVLKKLEVR